MPLAELLKDLNGKANGYKTYLSAAGLFGLAVYQLSEGQYEQAVNSFLLALGVLGLRHGVQKVEERL